MARTTAACNWIACFVLINWLRYCWVNVLLTARSDADLACIGYYSRMATFNTMSHVIYMTSPEALGHVDWRACAQQCAANVGFLSPATLAWSIDGSAVQAVLHSESPRVTKDANALNNDIQLSLWDILDIIDKRAPSSERDDRLDWQTSANRLNFLCHI